MVKRKYTEGVYLPLTAKQYATLEVTRAERGLKSVQIILRELIDEWIKRPAPGVV